MTQQALLSSLIKKFKTMHYPYMDTHKYCNSKIALTTSIDIKLLGDEDNNTTKESRKCG
jgi:hypothetical protein